MSFLVPDLTIPEEGVKSVTTNVETRVGSTDAGKGTLYIAESNITWISDLNGNGFTLNYPDLVLHAVSRDHNLYPRDCLYILVNGILDEGDEGGIGDEEDEPATEIRLAPEDPSILEDLYKNLQECSLLHQGPSSDLSDEEECINEEADGYVEDMEEEEEAEEDEDSDEERRNQFERMCLHFRAEFRNGSDHPPDNNPEDADQFADAD